MQKFPFFGKALTSFNNYLNKPCDTHFIDFFRITFWSILLLEAFQIAYLKGFYFMSIHDLPLAPKYIMGTWILSLIAIIVGAPFSLPTKIVSYVLTFMVLGDTGSVLEYHMDYAWLGVGFIAIFTPLNHKYSLENYLGMKKNLGPVPQHYYLGFLLVPVALIYFDSIFFKWTSPMWRNMHGLWLPASLPPIANLNLQGLLDTKWLVISASFVTIMFETVFMFLFWFSKARKPLFLIGVMLHVGILMAFPIPLFAFGYVSLYLLMLYGFSENPLPKKVATGAYFKFNKAIVVSFTLFVLIFQFFLIGQRPGIDVFGLKDVALFKKIKPEMRHLFGVTHHSVFMHSHFYKYNGQVKVVLEKPDGEKYHLTNYEDGRPKHAIYMSGRFWVYWAFRVNAPRREIMYRGRRLKAYTNYLIKRFNLCPDGCDIRVYGRKLDYNPRQYETGRLLTLKSIPWKEVKTWTHGKPGQSLNSQSPSKLKTSFVSASH